MEPSAVPKFASFRPKPSAEDPPESGNRKDNRSKYEPSTGRDKGHHHRRHRSHSRERETKQGSLPHRQRSSPQEESLRTFVVDYKGDVKNLEYGSIHRYSVPPFRRVGAGRVLGTASNLRIDRETKDDKMIVLGARNDLSSTSRLDRNILSRVERNRSRLVKVRPEAYVRVTPGVELNFVPFPETRRKRRRIDSSGGESDSEQESKNYRSIHGKAKTTGQPSDDELQFATESDAGSDSGRPTDIDASIVRKGIELSRKVEHSPQDIDAWLALIDHQDVVLKAGDDRHRVTNAEIRSTAEIKISMYEKALKQAQTLTNRETLLLGLMSEGTKIWEVKVQLEKWEQISKEYIQSLLLWKTYIDFRQSSFLSFQFEEIRDIFMKRLILLRETIKSGDPDVHESLYRQMIYILLRFTICAREAGYSELAVSIWQALLELNFFAPLSTTDLHSKLESFGNFWESEIPRIGEEGALGFRQFVDNENSSEPPLGRADLEQMPLDNKAVFTSWVSAERSRSLESRIPARTMDDVAEDDPFRVILVSDVESWLISLPESTSLRKCFIDAFLNFFGLPAMISDGSRLIKLRSDPFIRGEFLGQSVNGIEKEIAQKPDLSNCKEATISSIFERSDPAFFMPQSFACTPSSMFGLAWFQDLVCWRDYFSDDNWPIDSTFFANALKQLLRVHVDEDLAAYYMSWIWRNEPKTIREISKRVLKQYPSSLRLYNGYALIQWSKNKEEAKSIFLAALKMSSSMPESKREEAIILWHTWAWACLQDGDNEGALRCVLSISKGTPDDSILPSSIFVLKTSQHLASNRDHFLSTGQLQYAVMYTECLALLGYLTSTSTTETQSTTQGDISSALIIYSAFSQILIDRRLGPTISHERLLQSAAQLLYHHARVGPFRPSLVREQLTRSITLFPHNTIFLTLFEFNESRLRIENRVRSLFSSTVLTPESDCLTSRLFAIRYEIRRGTIHSARAAFEHAISAPMCKSSAAIWRFYILFCVQTPAFRSHVKDVWYRALRACPWVKELYILGFERLGEFLEHAELEATWRVMGEKGLRVHVDLEEKFEEIGEIEEAKLVKAKRLTLK